MKTKNVILTALVAMSASVLAFANEPANPTVVVVNSRAGIFKVIYQGAKPGKVSMKIFDKAGNSLFAETVKTEGGFIRPINFDGMATGVYTIEIADENGKQTQTVNYKNGSETTVTSVHIAKMASEGKYLLAIANKGTERIYVRIFDGADNLVHDASLTINGDFGQVYNLSKVAGTPSFVVFDKNGNDLVIKK